VRSKAEKTNKLNTEQANLLAYQLQNKYNYNCTKPISLQTDGLFWISDTVKLICVTNWCSLLRNPIIEITYNEVQPAYLTSRIYQHIGLLNGEVNMTKEPKKNSFEKKFGEGTAFDLDYGKLLIIGLCIYIAVQVT